MGFLEMNSKTKNRYSQEKGITLIALVITIIVLLIVLLFMKYILTKPLLEFLEGLVYTNILLKLVIVLAPKVITTLFLFANLEIYYKIVMSFLIIFFVI